MRSNHQTRKLLRAAVAEMLEDRRLLSGGLNTSWGVGGVATAPTLDPGASLVQPDGKLVVGGYTITYTGPGQQFYTSFALERFNANGSLDTSFGTNGLVTTNFTNGISKDDQITGLALQSNGDIVAAGLAAFDFDDQGNVAVARFTPNGTLDPTFGTGGQVLLSAQAYPGTSVAVQPNGGIILGYTNIMYPSSAAQDISRLNSNGTPDTSFGTFASAIDGNQIVMAVDGAGDIYFEDHPPGYYGAEWPARLSPTGQLDASFNTTFVSGVYLDPSPSPSYWNVSNSNDAVIPTMTGMAVEPNGDLVVAGTVEADGEGAFYPYLARYNTNGSFDTSFNTSGAQIFFAYPNQYFRSIAILPDGNIAANIGAPAIVDPSLIQFLPNGMLDTAFGTNGIAAQSTVVSSEAESYPVTYAGLSALPNGNLMLTGAASSQVGTVAAEFLGDMPTLAFTGAPTNAAVGSSLNVQVTVESSTGQPITNGDTITLSLGNNPGSATLGGNVTATAVNGVATFSNITISAIGSGYTLVATDSSSAGVASATSTAFNVGPANTSIPAGTTLPISNSSSGHSVFVTGGLTIAGSASGWTGTLDLTNNDADIINGSLATITNQVQQSYNGGGWTGAGITSSRAAADTAHLTALGVIQNNQSGSALYNATNPLDGTTPGVGDILVKYTYYGDANLDGKVDGSDYSRIDNGYVSKLTGWLNGDFNYDNVVNGSDYTLIDNAYEMQGASLAAIAAPAAPIAATPHRLTASSFSQVQIGSAAAFTAAAPATVASEIFGTDTGILITKPKRAA